MQKFNYDPPFDRWLLNGKKKKKKIENAIRRNSRLIVTVSRKKKKFLRPVYGVSFGKFQILECHLSCLVADAVTTPRTKIFGSGPKEPNSPYGEFCTEDELTNS